MKHPEFQTRTDSGHLLCAVCSLFLPFGSSQIIYINRPFCGLDCRRKGWMHEENGTLAIALCLWFTAWVFSVLECLCRTSVLREGLLLDTHMPSPTQSSSGSWISIFIAGFCLTHSTWYSQQKGLSALLEAHGLYSWLIVHVVSWIRNIHSSTSHPHSFV